MDLSPDSERVLRFANQVALEGRGKLHIIHAIQGGDPELPTQLHLDEQAYWVEREAARSRIADLQKRVGSDRRIWTSKKFRCDPPSESHPLRDKLVVALVKMRA